MVGFTGVTTAPHRMIKFHILHSFPLLVLHYAAANVLVNNVLGSEHPFVDVCRKLSRNIDIGGLLYELSGALSDHLGTIWGIVFGSQVYWTQANGGSEMGRQSKPRVNKTARFETMYPEAASQSFTCAAQYLKSKIRCPAFMLSVIYRKPQFYQIQQIHIDLPLWFSVSSTVPRYTYGHVVSAICPILALL